MKVNEHDRLSNITLRHKLNKGTELLLLFYISQFTTNSLFFFQPIDLRPIYIVITGMHTFYINEDFKFRKIFNNIFEESISC
jgi:hypothetical protein